VTLILVAFGFGVEGIWIAIAGTTMLKGATLGLLLLSRFGPGGMIRATQR